MSKKKTLKHQAKSSTKKKTPILWHRLFARMLEWFLEPVGITVQSDVKVSHEPLEADILLLENKRASFSNKQRDILPDGIKDCNSPFILIEFKYSESLNELALKQSITYDFTYKQTNNLKDEDLQTFVISSKTPLKKTLDHFGYNQTGYSGVYKTSHPILHHIHLLVLNELEDKACNAYIKCFSSKLQETMDSFVRLKELYLKFPSPLMNFLYGVWRVRFNDGDNMSLKEHEMTPEMVEKLGKDWLKYGVALMDPKDILKKYSASQVAKYYKISDLLEQYDTSEVLKQYDTSEVLKQYDTSEVLKQYDTSEVLNSYSLKDVFESLSKEKREKLKKLLEEK